MYQGTAGAVSSVACHLAVRGALRGRLHLETIIDMTQTLGLAWISNGRTVVSTSQSLSLHSPSTSINLAPAVHATFTPHPPPSTPSTPSTPFTPFTPDMSTILHA